VDNQEVDNQDRESLTEDADDDTAACSICAAQAFCEDDFKPACSAAFRVIDSIYSQAHDATLKTYPQPSHLEIFFHPMMQQEAQRLMSALEFLKLRPWSPKLVPALRRSFESDGPQRKRRRGEKG
jgi:hypothetical protein